MPTITLDANLAFQILVFAAVFSAVQAAWGLVRVGRAKRTVNRRLVLTEQGMALGDMVIELRKQRGLTASGERMLKWDWFADLVVRSGLVFRPRTWAIVAAGIAVTAGLIALVLSHTPLIAIAAGVAAGGLGPLVYLNFKASGRAKALSRQLPDALDVIVRSLEAGHPVPTAVALVGKEMPDPVGSEFGMAADEIAYGAPLEQAVGSMAARCRHPDIDLFAATVRLQDRSGGNLTGLLRMNAHTVRERHKLRLKIRSASSEGRASAMILTGAPLCVLGILQLVTPHFYGDVIGEPATQIGLTIMGVWMLLGNLVMRRMIDMRI
jgi:tight adherence protein B